jgi:hypothetical protein
MFGDAMRVGSTPRRASKSRLRGLDDAKTSLGFRPKVCAALFEAVGDPALGQIIRGEFAQNLVTHEYADTVFAHFSSGMAKHLVTIFQLDTEHGVGQQFADDAPHFQKFFFCHSAP